MVKLEIHPTQRDKLILWWNGNIPKGEENRVRHPRDILYVWTHLKGYAKWQDKKNYFLLSFSHQNLIRLRRQFPDLHFSDEIERGVRARQEEIRGITDLAVRIKEGWYDTVVDVDYKMPPLATYQHREVIYLSMIPKAPIFADCGTGKCRTGDARVTTFTGNFSLEDLFAKKAYDIKMSPTETVGKFSVPVFVPSVMPNGTAIWAQADGIYREEIPAGTKVKMVKTINNEPFILTMPHKLLINEGNWSNDFKAGDIVWKPAKIPDRNTGYHVSDSYTDTMITSYLNKGINAVKLIEQYNQNMPLADKVYFLKKFLPLVLRFYTGQNILRTIPMERSAIYSLADILLEFSIACGFETSAVGMASAFFESRDAKNLQDIIDDPALTFFSDCIHLGDSNFYKGHTRGEYLIPDRIVSCETFSLDKPTFVYDLMIPSSHNYIVDHVWSHNTFCVLVSTEHQIKQKIIKPGKTLIAGKLMTLETGWMQDAKKFTDLKINLLWAKPGKNKKQKILEKLEEDADVYLINHDGVRVFEKELIAKNFDKVVLDESTILKSYTGLKSRKQGGTFGKALARVAHSANWKVIMSGTPAPNGPQDVWGQINFLDPEGVLLERDHNDFLSAYMKKKVFGRVLKNPDGTDSDEPFDPMTPFKWVPKPQAVKKVKSILEPLAYRVKIEEHLTDLPEKTIVVRSLDMNRTQRTAYLQMKKDLETSINDELITVQNRLVSALKLRQITGGFAIDNTGNPQPLAVNPKLEMLETLMNEEIDRDLKVVVFAEYRFEIEMIAEKFADQGVVTVYGGNSSAKNLENVNQFINDSEVRLIVLHPRSAAHGITLTCAYYLVFYSISHSAEDNYQCIARVYRASQKHPTFIYYLLIKNSIDVSIYDVLAEKIRNQAEMIDQDKIDDEILRTLTN